MQRQAGLLARLAQLWPSGAAAAADAPSIQRLAAALRPSLLGQQLVSCRWFSGTPLQPAESDRAYITLNNIADNPGATHSVRRGPRSAPVGGEAARPGPALSGLGVLAAGEAPGPRHRLRPGEDQRAGAQGAEGADR